MKYAVKQTTTVPVASGKRGGMIEIGVQRKLFRLFAASAVFFTLLVGSLISVNVFADGENYVISYAVNSGGVTANSFAESTAGTQITTEVPSAVHDSVAQATFEKWHIAGSDTYFMPGDSVPTENFTVSGEDRILSLEAVWQKNIILEYVSEYGGATVQTPKAGYLSHGDAISLPNPAPDGDHYFKGWATNSGASVCVYPVSSLTATSVSIPVSDPNVYNASEGAYVLTLYPVWGDLVNVTYIDYIDRTNGAPKEYHEKVNPESFTTMSLSKTGYSMTWNTKADGTGTSYATNTAVTDITQQPEYNSPTKSVTLHSRWKKHVQYLISYKSTNGDTLMGNSSYSNKCDWDATDATDSDIQIRFSTQTLYRTKSGYTPLRYVDASGNTVSSYKVSEFTDLNSDWFVIPVTLLYEEETYTVTVRLNCTDADDLPPVKTYHFKYTDFNGASLYDIADEDGNVTSHWPTHNGMTFAGWEIYDAAGNRKTTVTTQNGKFSTTAFIGNGPTFTLMDQWNVNWSITPLANHPTAADPAVKTGTANKFYAYDNSQKITAVLSSPSSGGYIFQGYSLAPDATSADVRDSLNSNVAIPLRSFTPPSTADGRYSVTVYGQWTKKIKTAFIKAVTNPGHTVSTSIWKYDPQAGTQYYDEVWLSTSADSDIHAFQPPENPTNNYYNFNGWNTVPKIRGEAQNVSGVTELPLGAYSNLKDGYFLAYVYAIWEPKDIYFKYVPAYEIDGVISSSNVINAPVSDYPADYNAAASTVTRNYDEVYSAGGYQLSALSAKGYQFLGWYVNKSGTNEDKGSSQNANYLIASNDSGGWVEQLLENNPTNNTFILQARWHKYNKYTFLYDRNDAGLVSQMTRSVTNPDTGESETEVIQTFTGEYIDTTDEMLTNLTPDADEKWPDVFYQDEFDSRTVTKSGVKYLKVAQGNLTATGSVYDCWDCKYYCTGNAETASETITYDGVTYGYESAHKFYQNEIQTQGFRQSWVDDSDGDILAIFTARWDAYFGAVFDMNVPAGKEASVTAFPDARTQVLKASGNGQFGGSKVYDPIDPKPERTGYKFYGWSFDKDLDPVTDPNAKDKLTASSSAYKSKAIVPRQNCTEAETGCFRARVYAVWEPLYTYTFLYSLNRADLSKEGYPQGEYLGKDDASLKDEFWNAESETWQDDYDELFMNNEANADRFYSVSGGSRFRPWKGLLKSDHYIFDGWVAKTYQRNLSSTETNPEKYYTVSQGTFPGKYDLKETKTMTVSDITDGTNDGGIWSSYLKKANANDNAPQPTVTVLTARWLPRMAFVLKYHKNIGNEGTPAVEDYLTHIDSVANDGLSALEVNENGEWEDVLENEGISAHFVNGYYPLKHNRLQARGYKFIGWDMYYYRKANNAEGKRLADPYKYRFNSSGGFSDSYGIYNTWFNDNDCVDREFDLYAVWEPQYEVFYHEGVDDANLSEVSGMPDPKYSGIVAYKNWRGTGTKVFRASSPKRTGYYFVGWSTRSDLDVDTRATDFNYVLHRNSLGPSVPKSACSNPQHNTIDEGYLRADLYAVWSQKPVYSIYFDENADGETYPGIEYLGAVEGKHEPDSWTVRLTQEEVDALSQFYYFDRDVVLAARGYKFTGWHVSYQRASGTQSNNDYKLTSGTYGIYKSRISSTECPDLEFFVSANWEPQYKVNFYNGNTRIGQSSLVERKNFSGSSKVFKLNETLPSETGKYFAGWSTDPDYDFDTSGTSGLLRGTTSVNIPKSAFTNADYDGGDQGFLRADLYAVFCDQPVYYILYDRNEEALQSDPFTGEYLGEEDGTVWEIVVTQAELDTVFQGNSGYPLQRKQLKASGYTFTGWKLDYVRESTGMPSGGEYKLTLSDNAFRIYKTWFNDVVGNEFVLHAMWKRQFAVKFFPNGDNVTNMPAFEYSPLREEGRFTGIQSTAVFSATVPKREGYYFAGWSTDPEYNVGTQGLGGLLRRNHIGPAVPKNACVNALYSDAAPYDYKGFMCAYLYAVWSPTPVYSVFYDPNKAALTDGEYLSDSMPADHLVDGEWAFIYTSDQMTALLNSGEGENNKVNYYPLLKGDLTAKGYVYNGWTLSHSKANGTSETKTYDVSKYNQDAFRIYKTVFADTDDYQFLLTANWTPRYSVAFHENAGTDPVTNMPSKNPSDSFAASDFSGAGQTKVFSDKGSVPAKDPQRANYVFLGWSTDENATSSSPLLTRTNAGVTVALTDCTTAVEGSFRADLYAVWTNGYEVSYQLTGTVPNGASDLPESRKYPTGTHNIPVEPDMTAPGYNFSGWTVSSAPTGFTVSGGKFDMPDGDVLFTGSFTPHSYNVIYKANGATHATKPYSYGTEVTVGSGVADPTKANAVFNGWKYVSGLSGESAIANGKFTMPDSEVIFEAEFSDTYPVSYTARKDNADYTLPAGYETQRFVKGAEVTVKGNPPDINGYSFSGWSVQSPTGLTVTNGKFTMPEGGVTLYGEYTVKRANVTYYDDDDTQVGDEQTYLVGDEVTKGLDENGNEVSTPSHEGFTFVEWEIKDNSISETSIASNGKFTMPENTVKFRAVFKQNLRLIYDANGRTADNIPSDEEFDVKPGESVTRPLDSQKIPETSGELFRYWSTSPDGGEARNVTVSYKQNGLVLDSGRFNVRAYAVWSKKYTVSYKAYDIDGNQITLDPAIYGATEVYDGDEYTIAAPLTDSNYAFVGWIAEEPDGLEIIQSADGTKTFTMPKANVVLTGRFSDVAPVEFSITYRSGLTENDEGFTRELGTSHTFKVTADADGKATVKALANDSPELGYVREGYTFTGWKLTRVQPNPSPGGNEMISAPLAFAANGLIASGEVISIDSSVTLTAQWAKKPAAGPGKDSEKPSSPGTGESDLPLCIAFNLAIISMLAAGTVLRKRKAN